MDKRKSAKGRALEILGSVNPHDKKIILKTERIQYWLGVGAQASDRVYNILVAKEIIKGKKRPKKIRTKKKPAEGDSLPAGQAGAPGEEGKEAEATAVAATEKAGEEKIEETPEVKKEPKEEKVEEKPEDKKPEEKKEEKEEEIKPEEPKKEPKEKETDNSQLPARPVGGITDDKNINVASEKTEIEKSKEKKQETND